jgi:endo-1,4-beta-D-glucanase Y
MLARNASLLAFIAVLGSAVFVTSCAKPATVTTSCTSSQLTCGGSCVNAQTDPQNCGSCGKMCGNGSTCQGGACVCASGYVSCSGACVVSNMQHCGNSCTACASGDVCNADGTCSSTCTSGTKCSDNTCSSSTNPMDCGTCGNACPSGESCISGSCSCGSATQMYCSGTCVDITSTTNCGSCGNKCGAGQTCSNGSCTGSTTGTGGTGTGTGGTGTGTGGTGTGTGGTGTGTGGSGTGTGGTGTGTGGSPGTGGTGTGTGGSGTGTGGTGSGTRACAPASANVLSDFEEGTATGSIMIQQGTPARTGYWYVYYPGSPAAIMSGESQTPARSDGPIMQAAATDVPPGDTAACDKFALHSTGSGFGTAPNNYAGFGASFSPTAPGSQVKNKYDLSSYTGIKFNIKSGSGTPPPLFFEMLTADNQPTTSGGTAATTTIDLYNSRGEMLATPWIGTTISTTWQTVTVPFGTLIPRWVPAVGSGMVCPAAGSGVPKCQAPAFNPANVLALQFSFYQDPGFSVASSSTAGTYDIWVDDVQLTTDDSGLPAQTGYPLSTATAGSATVVGSCTKPKTANGKPADGKYLVTAYNEWKKTFANNGAGPVIRPENGNDTVSEGIAYGMLIAVNMNDKTTFDNLYTYWKGHMVSGTGTAGLMTWCQPAGSNSCSSTGGSATDADEDAAFALIQAGKVFGGTYASDAAGLISQIWAKDIDSTNNLPSYGSNSGNSTTSAPTNPSYFAPAYYRVFATIDSGHAWGTVATNSLNAINALAGTNGLVPAWCTNKCTAAGSGGIYQQDTIYQYDAHRVPMRVGLDYCWNATANAKTYTDKITNFFATNANAGLNGIGRIFDLYSANGTAASGAAPNSASIIGTAAVGAMASPSAAGSFLNDAYQGVFDMVTRGKLAPADTTGKTPYSYYNATVGMLTLLMMTGNFSH